MKRVIGEPVATYLGVDLGASAERTIPLLENDNCRAFPHHEPIAIAVERTAGRRRIIIPGRHRTDNGKGGKAERGQGSLGAACYHDIRIAPQDGAEAIADRDGARST